MTTDFRFGGIFMMTITEKAAYIKGLLEGMELDPARKETKIINALVDIIDDLALSAADAEDSIAAIEEDMNDMSEHINAVDGDLAELESYVLDEDYDDDFDPCDFCGGFGDEEDADDEDFWDDDVYEIECPECGEVFSFDESAFDDDAPLTCPKCGFVIDEIEFEDDDE